MITKSVEAVKNEPNVKFDVTAMGTIVEGDSRKILDIAQRTQAACFQNGVERCILTIKLDERHDKSMSAKNMESKVERQIGLG